MLVQESFIWNSTDFLRKRLKVKKVTRISFFVLKIFNNKSHSDPNNFGTNAQNYLNLLIF